MAVGRLSMAWIQQVVAEVYPEGVLRRALLAEDGQGDGHTPAALRLARWEFISRAMESGWTLAQAASPLGIKTLQARANLDQR